MEYPECSVMWRWIWGLLCLCVIQWCWLSGISVANTTPNKNCVWSPNCTGLSLALFCLCCVLMAACHIQPHFKMSVLPLCASLWLNVSCSRCFFLSSFSLVWLVKQCLPHPVVWSSALSLFLSKCQLLKEEIFLFSALETLGLLLLLLLLLTSHPGSLTVLLYDVLTTNGYILKDNSIPWCYKTGSDWLNAFWLYSVPWAKIDTFQ